MSVSFDYPKPVLGIAAFSGTGKTQLITQLIPLLKQRNVRIGVIKHAHHDVDIDKPGKDSFEMRKAGATPVVLASDKRIAVMIEKEQEKASSIEELLTYINPDSIDLVLIEGYKELDYNKLFLFRHQVKGRFQDIDEAVLKIMNHQNTMAIVTDCDEAPLLERLQQQKPVININQIEDVTQFILDYIKTETRHD